MITETRLIWDMPITIKLVDTKGNMSHIEDVFAYFEKIDTIFNSFKTDSEVSRINRGEVDDKKWSKEMIEVIALCEQTKKETNGYFDHLKGNAIDPLGMVKGWAVWKGTQILKGHGLSNFSSYKSFINWTSSIRKSVYTIRKSGNCRRIV